MTIKGIGTDIVDINRIRTMSVSVRQKLAKRVLTERELLCYEQKIETAIAYLAKRWAAKEAASKALGIGIAQGISFQDMEITNTATGKPEIALSGKAKEFADKLAINQGSISLSDEKDYAVAFVVFD